MAFLLALLGFIVSYMTACNLMFGRTLCIPCCLFFFSLQAEILDTDERMLAEEYVVGPVRSWLTSLIEWAGASTEYR